MKYNRFEIRLSKKKRFEIRRAASIYLSMKQCLYTYYDTLFNLMAFSVNSKIDSNVFF